MTSYTIKDLTQQPTLVLLEEFINNLGEAATTFRYFSKRDINIVKTHLVCFLAFNNNEIAAYGHLEKDGDTVWLGICVLPNQQGQKLGWFVMNELISKAKQKNVAAIDLTVDKINLPAISLYEKLGFKKVNDINTIFRYRLLLN